MGIQMNMNSYEIQRGLMESEYGEEVMCAGWIPADDLMCQLQPYVSTNTLATIPADLATVNPDIFMQRMYVHQR